jgi:N-acetylglutamate synthase-like GNAT family acetyltransferase
VVLKIRTGLELVDIDKVVNFHCSYVAKPYGLNEAFQIQLEEGLTAFASSYDVQQECFWFVEDGTDLVGTVAVVAEGKVARVRWLLAHPDYRKSEKDMLGWVTTFCQGRYAKVYLLAATHFERLAPLAIGAGFQKVSERMVELWGQTLTDERYELELPM